MGFFESNKKKSESNTPASYKNESPKERKKKIDKYFGGNNKVSNKLKKEVDRNESIKKKRRRSSGGSSSAARKAAEEKAKKEAEEKARVEAERKAKAEAEARENQRIQQRKDKIQKLQGIETTNPLTKEKTLEYVSRARNQKRNEQTNAKEELSKRIQASVSSEIRERQKKTEYTQQQTTTTPLHVENPNKKIDSKFQYVVDRGIGVLNGIIVSPLKGAKKKFFNKPNEINEQFVETGFASQYSNYQQVVFGEQTPSTEVLQTKQNFESKKSQIETKYKEDKDVKTFDTAATIVGVVVGGEVLAGVKGAGLLAQIARGTGNVIKTGVDAVGVAYGGTSIITAIKNPTDENVENAIIGGVAGVAGAGGLKSTIGNQAVRIGAKEVSAESVFNKQVLEGKQTFPTSKGAKDTYQKFKNVEKEDGATVVHATSVRNKFKKETDVEAGPMGVANKEDAILFTTPKGEGSSHFLGINGEKGYSLNPLNAWKGSKPGVIEVKASGGVKKLPGEIIETAKGKDFTKVNEFYANSADKTVVYPTVRSTLGHTSELEGGIAQGSRLVNQLSKSKNPIKKTRGYDEYVVIDGKTVPIKKYQLAKEKFIKDQIVENANVKASRQKVLNIMEYNKSSSRAMKNANTSYIGPRVPGFSSSKSTPQKSSSLGSSRPSFPSKIPSSYGGSSPGKSGSSVSPGGSSGGSSPGGSSPGGSSPGGSSPGGSSPGGSSGGGSSGGSPGGGSSGSSFGGSSGGSSGGGSGLSVPPLIPKVPILSSSEGFKPKSNTGYDVFIREKGKRIKSNKKPIPYNLALQQGKNIVDNTIAASFELQKRGITNVPDIPSQIIGDKFRSRRTKNALRVVEKSKNRIDTRGEKQGLSAAKFLGKFRL